MTLAFKIFVIILMSSIWGELSGIRKALENIEKGGDDNA
jgi:hypothetical protein